MLKKSLLSLCCVAALASHSVIAAQYQLAPKMDMTYSLPPHIPTEFHNPLFFSIKATCVMEIVANLDSATGTEVVEVVILKKSAAINGLTMNAGDPSQPFTIRNGDIMSINAKGGATAQLTNMGDSTITAHCTTN